VQVEGELIFEMKAAMRTPTSSLDPGIPLRVTLLWGAIYGALWSLAPGILNELLRMSRPGEAMTTILTGIITGVLVSVTLAPFLRKTRHWQAALLGILSLPMGAWLFGFLISWCHWGVMKLTGIHYRFVMQIVEPPGYVFGPLKAARDYALYSTLSPFGLLFIPLAVLTTLHLRSKMLRRNSGPMAVEGTSG